MPTGSLNEVIQHLSGTLLRDGRGLTDEQLLECFVRRRDQVALEELVRRHAPMVWGVCRRILRDQHDTEDAFQATFLVLVRRAATIRTNAGSWLYGVAHQTALKARATRAKRKARESQVAELPEPSVTEHNDRSDLRSLLDRELSRLPEKYRAVIVLCELESKSGKTVARELGCPEGTVVSRLSRAKAMLAKRLRRHGLGVSSGSCAALLPELAGGVVPASVMSSTIRAAALVAAGQATTPGVISDTVAALTSGVTKSMLRNKLKSASAVLLVGLLCVGVSGRTDRTQASGAIPAPADAPKVSKIVPAEQLKASQPLATRPPKPPIDAELENALKNPQAFMFVEQVTSKVETTGHSYDLVITSARGSDGKPETVYVRSGTMCIFRADAGVDEFTKKGGWYWRCGKAEGKLAFKEPGALIMVVRQHDGTVQWYSLGLDFRC